MKKGKGYAVNVPLRDGITDETFQSIFKPVRIPPQLIPIETDVKTGD